MIKVTSSAITAIEYDTRSRTLKIRFVSGELYAYLRVPEDVYVALMNAASKGTFFSTDIRDQYAFRHIGKQP